MRFIEIIIIMVSLSATSLISAQSVTSQSQNILFVGNSLTKYERNQILPILKEFFIEKEVNKMIDDFTLNGATLWFLLHNKMTSKSQGIVVENLKDADLYSKINENNYDLIIVQEDSDNDLPFPSFPESLSLLDSLANSMDIQLIVLENYKRYIQKYRNKNLSPHLDEIFDIAREREAILSANLPNINFIPTGYFVKEYRKTYPKSKYTYSIGGTHPSKNIQFLLACVIYKYLTGGEARELGYNFTLSTKNANLIKDFADKSYSEYYQTIAE